MVFQWIRLRTTQDGATDAAAARAAIVVAPGLNAVRTQQEEGGKGDGERSNFASYLNGLSKASKCKEVG